MAIDKNSFLRLPYRELKITRAKIALLIGILLMLSGCQQALTPEQVTVAFWESMAQGDIEAAKSHVTLETQNRVVKQQKLLGATVKTGESDVNGTNATVSTLITLNKTENGKVLSINTVLSKENEQWKVDYRQTLNNLLQLPFGDIFKSLQAIGDAINKELEQQIPLFEQQIRSFSDELIKQLDEFRRKLDQSIPPEKQKMPPGTI